MTLATAARSRRTLVRAGALLVAAVALGCVVILWVGVNAPLGDHRVDTWLERMADGPLHLFVLTVASLVALARGFVKSRERAAWIFLGIAITAWSAGEFHYKFVLESMANPPYPSISDALWLTTPVASYVALGLLMRSRVPNLGREHWLDGLIGACAVGGVGAAIVFQTVLDNAKGSVAAVATNLAYPLSDLILLAFVVTVFALTGWRPGRSWSWLLAGFITLAVADSIYAYRVASGTYVNGMFVDALWPLAMLMLAYAAWQREESERPTKLGEGWRVLAFPIVFAATALALLVYGNVDEIGELPMALAAASIVFAIARFAVTFRAVTRLMQVRREESVTDALTGLDNRRKLLEDLDGYLARAPERRPLFLTLFDLDGFKVYNDMFGHLAGDDLLTRLGTNLSTALAPWGTVYRLGGDEFCALLAAGKDEQKQILISARQALTEEGEGFAISASYGVVQLPAEANTTLRALQIADQRMYAHKDGGRASARSQMRNLLISVLDEYQPDLNEHASGVSVLAVRIGRLLGLSERELDDLARAADLHDVGKVAIPRAMLDKPGPLNDREWSFMRRHTLIGERILASAPALSGVARLVRSSHERWDGTGYPDRLQGDQIPLGARIIAVCDAYDAMIAQRPYQKSRSTEEALAELRRCAGTQFDPDVTLAFCSHIENDTVDSVDGQFTIGEQISERLSP